VNVVSYLHNLRYNVNFRERLQILVVQIFGGGDPYFGRTDVHRGSAMVLLDRALVSSYGLPIVTMPLTEAVWPQFAMQVFGGAVSTSFGEMGGGA